LCTRNTAATRLFKFEPTSADGWGLPRAKHSGMVVELVDGLLVQRPARAGAPSQLFRVPPAGGSGDANSRDGDGWTRLRAGARLEDRSIHDMTALHASSLF
jgi:hypothetical protein